MLGVRRERRPCGAAWRLVPVVLRVHFFLPRATTLEAQADGRSHPASILDALRDDGQPHETDWEYLAQLPADLTQWQPPAGVASLFKRAGEAGKDTV